MLQKFKEQLKKRFLDLAIRSIDKHHTKILVFYGWDWTEGLREASYQLLQMRLNCRRNYDWIRWDIGLPLFVLGYDYKPELSKISLFWKLIRAELSLRFKPSNYQDQLIISLNAKNPETIAYWLPILEYANVVIMPARNETQNFAAQIQKKVAENQQLDLRDLSAGIPIQGIETKILSLLKQCVEKLPSLEKWYFTETELRDAVLKVDWQRFVWERVKHNLRQPDELSEEL